jgi:hypothetical protein
MPVSSRWSRWLNAWFGRPQSRRAVRLRLEPLDDRITPDARVFTDLTLTTQVGPTYTGAPALVNAVAAAADGQVIVVDTVGTSTYNSPGDIPKSLTLLGPNRGINPNTGTRVAEAKIDTSVGGTLNIASGKNLVVDGFWFDGGVDVFVAFRDNYTLRFANNIVQNIPTFSNGGVYVSSSNLAAPFGYTAADISDNRFDNVGTGGGSFFAIRVSTGQNAVVSGNVITNSGRGVHLNSSTPSDGVRNAVVTNNYIANVLNSGISIDNNVKTASVTSNTIVNANSANNADRAAINIIPGGGSIGTLTIANNLIASSNNGILVRTGNFSAGLDLFINQNVVGVNAGLQPFQTGSVNDATVNLSGNWFGSTTPAGVAAAVFGTRNAVVQSYLSGTANLNTGALLATSGQWGFNPDLTTVEMLVPVRSATSGVAKVDGSVQTGVTRASSGFTVRVAAETYTENVALGDRSLTVVGAVNASAIVGTVGGTGTSGKTVSVTDLSFAGGTFAGYGSVTLGSTSTVAGTYTLDGPAFQRGGDQPTGSVTLNVGTFNVVAGSGADTFTARPSLIGGGPVLTLAGGQPTLAPGDTLALNLSGLTAPVVSSPATPNGNLTSTSHQSLAWTGIETASSSGVPASSQRIDFGTATSPVQPGYVLVTPTDLFTGGADPLGWDKAVAGYDRGPGTPTGPFSALLRDGVWTGPFDFTSRTFNVQLPADSYQLTLTLGDMVIPNDQVQLTIEGTPVVRSMPTGKFIQYTTTVSVTDGVFNLGILDLGGQHAYWVLNALDIRPVSSVVPVAIVRTSPGTDPLLADGLSVASYSASNLVPNSVATVQASTGTILSTDLDPVLAGVQVAVDGTGTATFSVRLPTGNAPLGLSVTDGGISAGTFTQTLALPTLRSIDFDQLPTSVTAAGYLSRSTELYTSAGVNGLGWVSAPGLYDRGTADALTRDGAWGFAGMGNERVYVLDVPTASPYTVTVYLGDPGNPRANLTVGVWNGTAFMPTITGANTTATGSYTFAATPVAGQIRLQFGATGGGFWTLAGLEVRPTLGTLALSPAGSSVVGNGINTTPFTVTGGVPNSLVTVTTTQGQITTADASSIYDGIQIVLDGSGAGSLVVQAPTTTVSVTGSITATSVTGFAAGSTTQTYTPGATPITRFDFNSGSSPNLAGATGVLPTTLYTPANGFGWQTAVNGFFRTNGSYPTIVPTTGDFYRDGAWGFGTSVFQVSVPAGSSANVRVYAYDPYTNWGQQTVTVEGGTGQTLFVGKSAVAVYTLSGTDTNNDGILNITIQSGYVWIVNGLEVSASPFAGPPVP